MTPNADDPKRGKKKKRPLLELSKKLKTWKSSQPKKATNDDIANYVNTWIEEHKDLPALQGVYFQSQADAPWVSRVLNGTYMRCQSRQPATEDARYLALDELLTGTRAEGRAPSELLLEVARWQEQAHPSAGGNSSGDVDGTPASEPASADADLTRIKLALLQIRNSRRSSRPRALSEVSRSQLKRTVDMLLDRPPTAAREQHLSRAARESDMSLHPAAASPEGHVDTAGQPNGLPGSASGLIDGGRVLQQELNDLGDICLELHEHDLDLRDQTTGLLYAAAEYVAKFTDIEDAIAAMKWELGSQP